MSRSPRHALEETPNVVWISDRVEQAAAQMKWLNGRLFELSARYSDLLKTAADLHVSIGVIEAEIGAVKAAQEHLTEMPLGPRAGEPRQGVMIQLFAPPDASGAPAGGQLHCARETASAGVLEAAGGG